MTVSSYKITREYQATTIKWEYQATNIKWQYKATKLSDSIKLQN